jgi:hypothetical protein
MEWSAYGSFLVFAVVLILIPGPDFAVVTKNALVGGRRRGVWTALGVACSNAVQGSAAAVGLGAMIVRAQPLFQAIKWAGVAYLAFLGAQALRSAAGGQYAPLNGGDAEPRGAAVALGGWRQGFLVQHHQSQGARVLPGRAAAVPRPRGRDSRTDAVRAQPCRAGPALPARPGHVAVPGPPLPRTRRGPPQLDGATGLALVGFSARLAAEQA